MVPSTGRCLTHDMPKRTIRRVAVLALLPCVSACSAEQSAEDGECSARIRYEGVVYRSHNELNAEPSSGLPLGTGDVIGCGGDAARVVEQVEVSAVGGVTPSLAIVVRTEQWRGTYVSEHVPRSEWPTQLELE